MMEKATLLGLLCVVGGIIIQLTYGYFYTIANMAPYIMDYFTYINKTQTSSSMVWVTSLSLCAEAIAMPLGGLMEKATGARWVIILSCIIQSGGIALTYFTISLGLVGLIMTYSIVQGFGFGFGYSVTMSVAAAWFPKRRGLVVGLIVGGFGAGALLFTPIQTAYINPMNLKVDNLTRQFTDIDLLERIPKTFLILSVILALIQCIGIALFRSKTENNKTKAEEPLRKNDKRQSPWGESNAEYCPVEVKSETEIKSVEEKNLMLKENKLKSPKCTESNRAVDLTPKQALKTLNFYLLWFAVFSAVVPVTTLASLYKVFGQTYISDDLFLSGMVMAASICNAVGRVIWGFISDRLSFKAPFFIMLSVWSIMLFTFPHISALSEFGVKVAFAIYVPVLYLLLSGLFVLAPAATETLFGPTYMAVNYGLVYNAFIFGSLSAAIISNLPLGSGGWVYQFYSSGFMCVLALFIVLWINDRKLHPWFRKLDLFVRIRKTMCCRKNIRSNESEMQA